MAASEQSSHLSSWNSQVPWPYTLTSFLTDMLFFALCYVLILKLSFNKPTLQLDGIPTALLFISLSQQFSKKSADFLENSMCHISIGQLLT